MFKFLHAADIHLDSPLRGLDRYDGAPVEEVRGATRRALENLVAVAVEQQTRYPWDGDVRIRVSPAKAGPFGLRIRVPGWALNHPVPGDLYRDLTPGRETVTLKVNGLLVPIRLERDGDDSASVRAAVEQLNRATATFAARRMDRGVRQAHAGRAVDTLA